MLSAGLLFGGVNAIFYARSLKSIDLAVAYPVFSAGTMLLVTGALLVLFREGLTLQKAAGMLVICAGIALVR
ncbi:MAG: hypothetical protein JXA20_14610 [Spirochaetes bacterium]|nr:hypothetical protein [Spirochaetota bacterium]